MNKFKLCIAVLSIAIAFQSCKKEETNKTVVPNLNASATEITSDTLSLPKPEDRTNTNTSGTVMFSTAKNKEIDLAKDGITLNSVEEKNTDKAYLVFNDDQSKVEVFLPGEKKGALYDRKGTEGNYTWTDGKNEIINWKGYVLRTVKDAKPLFGGE